MDGLREDPMNRLRRPTRGGGVRVRPSGVVLKTKGMPIEAFAGAMFIVRDQSRPVESTQICRVCGQPHTCKTYHLQLDQDSTAIISHGIWDALRGLFDHGGLEAVNDVAAPPAQTIVLPTAIADVSSRMSEIAKEVRRGNA